MQKEWKANDSLLSMEGGKPGRIYNVETRLGSETETQSFKWIKKPELVQKQGFLMLSQLVFECDSISQNSSLPKARAIPRILLKL